MSHAPSSVGKAAQQAKNKAEQTARQPWVEGLARFGYAARGVLYIVVGVLAVMEAFGQGSGATDKNGALAAIDRQPFGQLLLILMVIGLAGYSLWGFIRAILDPFDRGTDPKGIAQRIGYVVSGISYGALILPAIQLLRGGGSDTEGGNAAQDWSAAIMSHQSGKWLVIILGLVALAGGFGQLWQAFTADFQKDLKFREMSRESQDLARNVGRFGHAARGVVFALGGFFLVKAGWDADPKQARGLEGSLQALAEQPYGPYLLGLVALGLISFGVYSVLCARWIKLNKHD